MSDISDQYFEKYRDLLIEKTEDLISGKMTLDQTHEFVEYLWDEWEKLGVSGHEPDDEREEVFWTAVWSVYYTLNDEWEDDPDYCKSKMSIVLNHLKKGTMPAGYMAKRP